MNNKIAGITGEEDAALFLKSKGYVIIARNKKIAGVEIDIVCKRADTVVFCEVKSRESEEYGRGVEAVDRARQARYVRAGKLFMADRQYRECSLRFDVIEVVRGVVNHIEDAFRA